MEIQFVKNGPYPPKVQSKQDIITDLFLEKGLIHFSGKLSTGTDPAINFGLAKCITKNKYT